MVCQLFTHDQWPQPGMEPAACAAQLRALFKQVKETLRQNFLAGESAEELVPCLARTIDEALQFIWPLFDISSASLVAVGGYGRGELHPNSDVDLLILLPEDHASSDDQALSEFLTFLWDVGLEIGHSVRTVSECVQEASNDQTIITNLVETRFLCGDESLFKEMQQQTGTSHLWSSREFFLAKLQEQQERYNKFGEAAYNLEPNLKEGAGGLRDIHMIGWILKRHFNLQSLKELVNTGFLTRDECELLMSGRNFLWKVRFALHVTTGRREDRLLFDFQRDIATLFGYRDEGHRLGVEQFMKQYYQTILELRRLNEMLLALFQQAILHDNDEEIRPINARFQARNDYLELREGITLQANRFAIMETFLLMQQHRELKGVSATTIREIRSNLHLITDSFREDIRSRATFLEMFRYPVGLTHELRRMNRYGVLAQYLPAFGAIVGLMQYDLFHVYTVDEHTLMVLRNLRRMAVPEFADEHPLGSRIINQISKPELLYLAGLFHDIAKGQGGDHSALGEGIAKDFCRTIGLSEFDADLVGWLVANHLIMSTTAQRKDISDPEVVQTFAKTVQDQMHLDYLYLLTTADIRGTNPKLWNDWKDSLLRELYHATGKALRRDLGSGKRDAVHIRELQSSVLVSLQEQGIEAQQVLDLWKKLDDEYFLRHSADEVSRNIQVILNRPADEKVTVALESLTHRGGTEIFIYMPDGVPVFLIVTQTIARMQLSIVDARIISTSDGMAVNTFIVLEQDGTPVSDDARLGEIQRVLQQNLATGETSSLRRQVRPPRRLKHFAVKPYAHFHEEDARNFSVLEVHATDHIGLLAEIAEILHQHDIFLHNAKIATFGERAEDIFFITDNHGAPLNTEQKQSVHKVLLQQLTDEQNDQ